MNYYILDDDNNPVKVPSSQLTMAQGATGRFDVGCVFFEHVIVSTIFLGVATDSTVEGDPVLWSTATFVRNENNLAGAEIASGSRRYTSYNAALAGHNIICLGAALGDFDDEAKRLKQKSASWWHRIKASFASLCKSFWRS